MSADIIIPAGLKGDTIQLIIRTEDGKLDDLTQYDSILLNVFSGDYTTNPVANLEVVTFANAQGEILYDPAGVLTTPGMFWIVVTRKDTTTIVRPATNFSLEVTRVAA